MPIFLKALSHVKQISQETSGEVVYGGGRQPAMLRACSQRLSQYVFKMSLIDF